MTENTRELLNKYIDWCDELKEENKKLKAEKEKRELIYAGIEENNRQLVTKNNQLKAENEELKICYKNNLAVLKHEEKVNNNLTDRCMKAEQALQEIRQVVEFAMEEVLTIGQRNATAKILEILQKCEVLENE